jgi:MFS family permease
VAGTIPVYICNLFGPHLIAEFGWSPSEFALVGMVVVISVIGLPVAGRLADIYGMRRIALAGVIALPLVFVGLALQPGSFAVFFLLSLTQMLCVSSLVGIVVYNRLLVREFTAARGLALGLAACAPAVVTAISAPMLSGFITANGWRAGYFLLAGLIAVGGLIALALIPRGFDDRRAVTAKRTAASGDYREIFRDRGFLILICAILLCNLQFPMLTSQTQPRDGRNRDGRHAKLGNGVGVRDRFGRRPCHLRRRARPVSAAAGSAIAAAVSARPNAAWKASTVATGVGAANAGAAIVKAAKPTTQRVLNCS